MIKKWPNSDSKMIIFGSISEQNHIGGPRAGVSPFHSWRNMNPHILFYISVIYTMRGEPAEQLPADHDQPPYHHAPREFHIAIPSLTLTTTHGASKKGPPKFKTIVFPHCRVVDIVVNRGFGLYNAPKWWTVGALSFSASLVPNIQEQSYRWNVVLLVVGEEERLQTKRVQRQPLAMPSHSLSIHNLGTECKCTKVHLVGFSFEAVPIGTDFPPACFFFNVSTGWALLWHCLVHMEARWRMRLLCVFF